MSSERDDLEQLDAALRRLIEIGDRLIRLGASWATQPRRRRARGRDSSQALFRAQWDRLRAEHREAWVREAALRGVPARIAELQWRDVWDGSAPLRAAERAELERWDAAQQAEREDLQRHINGFKVALDRLEVADEKEEG